MPDEPDQRTPSERARDAIADQYRARSSRFASPYAQRLHDEITGRREVPADAPPADQRVTVRPSRGEILGENAPRDPAAGRSLSDLVRAQLRGRQSTDDEDPTGTDQRPETDQTGDGAA